MKSAKTTLKAKKLSIKKDTLRTLSESDLRRADGAQSTGYCYYMPSNNTAWCSSYPNTKCQA
ncbi:MAG TPA: hypothetical protein VF945_03215 [Polyangia bacterium]